jgi:hypothetical protein
MGMYHIYHGTKIIEIVDGTPKFMFCGLNGSRTLTLNRWLHAEEKLVKDGRGTEYLSGFHILNGDIEEAKQYIKRFKNLENKFLVSVCYEHGRRKPTKGSLAVLAKSLLILDEYVKDAIPLIDLT